MDSNKLYKGLAIAGAGLGIVGGALSIYQTVDQMRNGVKLRDDQVYSIARIVANNVSENCMNQIHADLDTYLNGKL